MAQRVLSIDIREDVVCGVLLSFSSGEVSVINCGISVPGERPLGESVTEVLNQVGYADEPCRVSFGAEHFYYRNLSFPFSDKKKIEKILAVELEDNVIVDMDNLLVDSLVSGKKGEDSAVVAAMIDRDLLQQKLDELAELNIDPETVSISSAQIALQLVNQQNHMDFVLLDAGCRRVTVFIVVEGQMRLVRTMVFDDGSLANFNIDKNSQQVAPRKPEKTEETFKSMCKEIRHTLYALDDVVPSLPLFLTGALAEVPQFDTYLEEVLGCEVTICNIVREPVSIGLGSGLWRGDIMSSALALGLRKGKKQAGFNFRKHEFTKRISFEKYRNLIPRLGIPAAVCLLFLIVYSVNSLNQREKELDELTLKGQQIFSATLPDVKRIVDPVQQLKVKIAEIKKGMLGEASLSSDIKVLDLMAEISVRIPNTVNVHVVRMVADRESLLLRGLTDNFNSVDNLKKVLEKSGYFSSVLINSANLSTKTSGIRFELKVDLNRG